MYIKFFFFFFQAEDGIRDYKVTGVQTCALPIFPKPGILFKDITTLLKDGESFRAAVDGLLEKIGKRDIDCVVAMESRGFIFGAPIAYKLGVGMVPVRK